MMAATLAHADEAALTWRLVEGGDFKTGITCEGCGAPHYTDAFMTCEGGGPNQRGRTSLYILGDICGTQPKCAPYLVVNGERMLVKTKDMDDDAGIAIVVNDDPRLWTALETLHSLKFGMKGRLVSDLTVPGLTATFAQVLAACGGR